jgi:pimeloyl-ACP methyl ester carboxylesterase
MREQIIRFGADNSVIGILTTGEGGKLPRLGCILPNIGLAHRIGPHRVNVKVARELARHGVSTVRFDLSGVGDSPKAKTSDGLIDQAVADMRDAMNHMEQSCGISRFIVFGICSGAQNGYFLALNDERIVGLLMYDGFDFPSLMSRFDYVMTRIRSTPWRELGSKLVHRLSPRSPARTDDIFTAALNEMHPSPDQFRAALEKLVTRGVSIFVFYSGSRRTRDNDRGLLGALGDRALLDKITYRFDGDMDHTATSQESQRKLLALISGWAQQVAVQ